MLDGEPVGRLEYTGIDNFWLYGKFHPLPAFQKCSQLFERLEAVWSCNTEEDDLIQNENDPLDIQDKANGLDLQVKHESGMVVRVRDFKIQQGVFEHKNDYS
jgi:hypothetical protein